MHEVLVNRLGGLSLPRKSVVKLTDRPDMTLDVYRGRKTTMQQQQQQKSLLILSFGKISHRGYDKKWQKYGAIFNEFSSPFFQGLLFMCRGSLRK